MMLCMRAFSRPTCSTAVPDLLHSWQPSTVHGGVEAALAALHGGRTWVDQYSSLRAAVKFLEATAEVAMSPDSWLFKLDLDELLDTRGLHIRWAPPTDPRRGCRVPTTSSSQRTGAARTR